MTTQSQDAAAGPPDDPTEYDTTPAAQGDQVGPDEFDEPRAGAAEPTD
jgi:hypothetical protein